MCIHMYMYISISLSLSIYIYISTVAEQGRGMQSWMSRAKHPMLRLSQNVTT